VVLDRTLRAADDWTIRWSWQGPRGDVTSARSRGALEQVGSGRYLAKGRAMEGALEDWIKAVAAAVVCHEGGTVLHCAGVELDGGAVLFLGPSGAGKSTACTLFDEASVFIGDRAALFPSAGRWLSAPLMRGDAPPPGARFSTRRLLPVRGLLRVRQSTGEPRIQAVSRVSRLLAVRESLMGSGGDFAAEDRRLETAERIATSIPAAIVDTVLHGRLDSLVRRWLSAAPSVGGAS
jgi:hypothetical protein